VLAAAFASLAVAASGVQPVAGDHVVGRMGFPRAQRMEITVQSGDRLAFSMGFDARCAHGGIDELWISNVVATTLPVAGGAFAGRVSGSDPDVVRGRVTYFWWNVSGRFTGRRAAVATVDGRAVVRSGRRVLSRCAIAHPVRVSLR